MSDLDETPTERARRLIARTDELLEQTNNRPRYESSWSGPEERSAVSVPVRRVTQEHRAAPFDNKGWNDWANEIVDRRLKTALKAVADVTGKELAARDARIAELERRLSEAELKLDPDILHLPSRAMRRGGAR